MMYNYNQLFRVMPDIEFLNKLVKCFGLESLNDTSPFDRHVMKERDTVNKIYDLYPDMLYYYIPCKGKLYLDHILNEDRCLTILRQFLKLYDYTLDKQETVTNKKKILVYTISNNLISKFSIINKDIKFDMN